MSKIMLEWLHQSYNVKHGVSLDKKFNPNAIGRHFRVSMTGALFQGKNLVGEASRVLDDSVEIGKGRNAHVNAHQTHQSRR